VSLTSQQSPWSWSSGGLRVCPSPHLGSFLDFVFITLFSLL
jgi:hypothetical protein